MTWLQKNYQGLIAIAGALWTLLSVINGLVQNPEAKSILGKVMDALSFLTRASAPGTVKAPFSMSKAPVTAGTIIASQSTRALLLLAFLALGLSACAGAKVWSVCTLGQLPNIAQPFIPDIIQDLSGPSATTVIQQIEQVGGGLAPGQIACIVQAIVADIGSKSAALSTRDLNIISNGNAFLAKHPACCGVKP